MHLGCILLGAPGSGKGTQAKILSENLNIPHISTGDILRKEVQEASSLGLKVQEIIASGKLVSDDLIIEIVKKRFQQSDVRAGYILDGFPRTVAQAESFESIIRGLHFPDPKVILLDVAEEALIDRLTGRLTCGSCGQVYHLTLNPPKKAGVCDLCGGSLESRKDDSRETVTNRLKVYEAETAPLISFYSSKGWLTRVGGEKALADINRQIEVRLKAG